MYHQKLIATAVRCHELVAVMTQYLLPLLTLLLLMMIQVCCELVTMVQHLALVLTELLQLERTVCGGPGRDGTVLVNESGNLPLLNHHHHHSNSVTCPELQNIF
jgi:hypothetical protein